MTVPVTPTCGTTRRRVLGTVRGLNSLRGRGGSVRYDGDLFLGIPL